MSKVTKLDNKYNSQKGEKLNEECNCWRFPEIIFKREPKIRKKKYCFLYPKVHEETAESKPNFEHCKTLYTKCDYMLEQCVHQQILKLEDEFKHFASLSREEIEYQRDRMAPLYRLSYRYFLLTRSITCIRPYPEILSHPEEERILCEFHSRLKVIKESNYRIKQALKIIKESLQELERRCNQLDMTVESEFILGDCLKGIKPLSAVRAYIEDLYKYFRTMTCQLDRWLELIDVAVPDTILDYKTLLNFRGDFSDLTSIMPHHKECKCKRSEKPDCLKTYKPC